MDSHVQPQDPPSGQIAAKDSISQQICHPKIRSDTMTTPSHTPAFVSRQACNSVQPSTADDMLSTRFDRTSDNNTEASSMMCPGLDLSSDTLLMDSAWLESIAFSLEQFPPDGHFLGTSLLPNGFMPETGSEYSQGDFSVYGAASAISGAYSPISHGSMSSFDASAFSQSTRPGSNSLGYQTKVPSFDYSGPGLASRDDPQDLTRQTQAQHSRLVRSDSPSSQDSDEGRLQEKRRRNKIAARKLRQKRADQVSDLESKLEEMRKERDDLRVKAAKWEGEVMILRELLGRGKGT